MSKRSVESDAMEDGRRHLCFGWGALVCFLTLGMVLEILHGFKVRWYLDASNDTRRLLWTLAHAHGTLLGIVNICFGLTVRTLPEADARWRRIGSPCLIGATVLLPMGFFLGGLYFFAGDSGVGIFLVPIGAVLLFVGTLLTALGVASRGKSQSAAGTDDKT